jgi:hypothetical protein
MWMSRFAGLAKPRGEIAQSVALHAVWGDLKREREAFDETIIGWADRLDLTWLAGDLT